MSLVLECAIPNLMFDQFDHNFPCSKPTILGSNSTSFRPSWLCGCACTLGEATMRPPVMPWSSYSCGHGDPGHILIEGVVGLLKGWLRANHQQPLAIYSPQLGGTVEVKFMKSGWITIHRTVRVKTTKTKTGDIWRITPLSIWLASGILSH